MIDVGDEVVCLRHGRAPDDPTMPGEIYVVSEIFWNNGDQAKAIRLQGIRSEGLTWDGHDPTRFRKVLKSKTDMWTWAHQPTDYEQPKAPKREKAL